MMPEPLVLPPTDTRFVMLSVAAERLCQLQNDLAEIQVMIDGELEALRPQFASQEEADRFYGFVSGWAHSLQRGDELSSES